jgi:hypothetical protein
MTREQAVEMLNSHAAKLSEHFDAVLILASYLEPDGTTAAVAAGQGNWYARVGMAHKFVEKSRAEDLVEELSRQEDDDQDEQ